MKTATKVDITMKQLHKYFEKYQIANPAVKDPELVIANAVDERWPGADPDDVLREAEINWLIENRNNMVRDAARNVSDWIDTTVQGDLFNDMQMRVPRWFMIDGEAKEYWKVSMPEALAFHQTREVAFAAEAGALQQAADHKNIEAERERHEILAIQRVIRIAEENGIDPNTVKYAKQD